MHGYLRHGHAGCWTSTRPRHWVLLGFLALLVGILAPLAQEAHAQANAGEIEFYHEDGVPLQYRQEVEEGTLLAKDYLFRTWNLILPRPLTVMTFPGDGVAGFASVDLVGFNTGSPVWTETTSGQRIKIAVHEYLHVAQSASSDHYSTGYRGYAWIVEGSAEYLAYDAVIEQGIVARPDADLFHTFNVTYSSTMPPLDLMEDALDYSTGPVYSLAYLAVEQLAQKTSKRAIRDYFERLGERMSEDEAFASTFGLTPEEFYAEFAEFRASLAFPGSPPAALIPPGPVLEYPAFISVFSLTTPIAGGSQALLTAGTDPAVRCVLDVLGPDGSPLDFRPTQSDRNGMAIWFWTIEREQSGQQLTLAANCGGDPAYITLEVT